MTSAEHATIPLPTDGPDAVIDLQGISRTYYKPDGSVLVEALADVDLTINRGEYVAITTKLHHMIGMKMQPSNIHTEHQ